MINNEKGFEGDSYLKDAVKNLCKKHKVSTIIETGTYYGNTTKHLAEMAEEVLTCEIATAHFNVAVQTLQGIQNVQGMLMGSVEFLSAVLPHYNNKNILFFLDAHWGPNNPLLQELYLIAENKLKPVIVIHDFKVPGHPELGYDVYGPIVYEWDYIAGHIKMIYGDNYTISYNSKAEGAMRGVIFIEPKKSKK